MSAERICIKWNGNTECYEDNNWLSPRVEAFERFLRKHKEEDEILDDLYNALRGWIRLNRTFEKSLFGYDGLSKTSDERMKLTVEEAEQKLQEFLVSHRENSNSVFSIHRIFGIRERDPEYEDLSDIVCAEIADLIGWNICGNPWNNSLIDHQYMTVSMHMERNGSLKYNWYMEFRHPDFLVDTIDLDAIFDRARKELLEYDDDYEEV